MKNSLAYQTYKLVKSNGISIDKEELYFQIESHPSYPSLHAVTGVLSHFNIDNLALEVPVDREVIKQLPKSFLALFSDHENQKEFVVTQKTGNKYSIHREDGSNKLVSETGFLNDFTGIILAITKGENFVETTSKRSLSEKIAPAIILFLMYLVFLIFQPAFSAFSHFILSSFGAIISYILILEENGISTAVGDQLCSGASEKKDCKSVIQSKGGKFLGLLKLSELSFSYFLTMSISALISITSTPNLNFHYLISLAVIPIALYSIIYQTFIVKKWCTICLGIVAVLITQFMISLYNYPTISWLPGSRELLAILIGAIAAFILIVLLLPTNILINDLKKTKAEYFKFKRDESVFKALLLTSKTIQTAIPNTSEIILGNQEASLNITLLTNPFCKFCQESHQLIEKILHKYGKSVSVTVRFNVDSQDIENNGFKVSARLIELYHQAGQNTCMKAMKDIYTEGNSEIWFNKWEYCEDVGVFHATIKKGSNWCVEHHFNFTPTIFINDRLYPKEYGREELLFFMEDLIEESKQSITTTEKMNFSYG